MWFSIFKPWPQAQRATDQQGTAMVEYVVLIALIAGLGIPALGFVGTNVSNRFNQVAEQMEPEASFDDGNQCGHGNQGDHGNNDGDQNDGNHDDGNQGNNDGDQNDGNQNDGNQCGQGEHGNQGDHGNNDGDQNDGNHDDGNQGHHGNDGGHGNHGHD